MTVAMSRARLGLYILGQREVFEACHELRPSFDILLERPDKLMLVTGELWPTQRPVIAPGDDSAVESEVAMEGVEHLGQYVFEMTNTKVKQLEGENSKMTDIDAIREEDEEDETQNEQGTYYDEADGALEPDIQEIREGDER